MKNTGKVLIALVIIVLIAIVVFTNTKNNDSQKITVEESENQSEIVNAEAGNEEDAAEKSDSLKDWKSYVNNTMGLQFMYPKKWSADPLEPMEVMDRKGKVNSIQINFIISDQSNLTLIYRIDGRENYNYKLSEFNASSGLYASSKEKVMISGLEALKSTNFSEKNGRGKQLEHKLKKITLLFAAQKGNATYELQYQDAVTDSAADNEENFNKFISSIQLLE